MDQHSKARMESESKFWIKKSTKLIRKNINLRISLRNWQNMTKNLLVKSRFIEMALVIVRIRIAPNGQILQPLGIATANFEWRSRHWRPIISRRSALRNANGNVNDQTDGQAGALEPTIRPDKNDKKLNRFEV